MEGISDGELTYSFNINDANIVPMEEISKKHTFSCNVDNTNISTIESLSNIQTVYSCNKNGANTPLMEASSKTITQTCYSSNINLKSRGWLSKSQTIPLFNKDNASVVMKVISDGEPTYSYLNIQTPLCYKYDNNVTSMESSLKTKTSALFCSCDNNTDSIQNNIKCRKIPFILEQSTFRIFNTSQVSKYSFSFDKISPNGNNFLLCTAKDTSRENYADLKSYQQKKSFKVDYDDIKSSKLLSYKNCSMLSSNNFTNLYGVHTISEASCISYSQSRSVQTICVFALNFCFKVLNMTING